METRKPAYSGKFYPNDEESIAKLIYRIKLSQVAYIDYKLAEKNIIGGIVPHAGYYYSGYQAVHLYEILAYSNQKPETFIIINPNHTGKGVGSFNTCNCQYWETPMGRVEVDQQFGEALDIIPTEMAHKDEHSGEVQIPFLQYFFKHSFQIVVITQNIQKPESSIELAQKIHSAKQKLNRNIVVIASSDFSHYVDPKVGFEKDQYMVDEIMHFNTESIYQKVVDHRISACGYGPIMALSYYSKLCCKNPEMHLLKRGHSGEIQNPEEVVDYISFLSTCNESNN